MKTADLCDDPYDGLQVAEPVFRDFGGLPTFLGPITTLRVFEDNSLVRAGTMIRSASSAYATLLKHPVTRHPSPSGFAIAEGRSGSRLPESTSAGVMITRPCAMPPRNRSFCSGVPNSASGSAEETRVSIAGIGATVRPTW